jgi:hypothetical protein
MAEQGRVVFRGLAAGRSGPFTNRGEGTVRGKVTKEQQKLIYDLWDFLRK